MLNSDFFLKKLMMLPGFVKAVNFFIWGGGHQFFAESHTPLR
jgi:hypothetical protein